MVTRTSEYFEVGMCWRMFMLYVRATFPRSPDGEFLVFWVEVVVR